MVNLDLVIKAHDQASAVLRGVDDSAHKAGNAMGTVLKVGALAAGAGLIGAGFAAVKFIGAASDLNESINKSSVVFGGAQKVVEDFAATSAKSFGIAKGEAFAYAGTLGTILKGSGLSQEASAGMSTELVKLAADMASFNNIPIDQALEKIRAGLVGESEPLRTVGVLLSEAAVQEEAYASGIAAAGSKLTDAQKVQARYSLILKQTADTQGDFARTSDGMANQQRVLAAQWKDLQGIIGNALLPVATKLLGVFVSLASDAMPKIQAFIKTVSNLASLFGAALTGDLDKAHTSFLKLPKSIWPIGQAVFDVGSFIRTELIPALKDAFGFIQSDVLPVVQDFAATFKADVIPVLRDAIPHVIEFGMIMKDIIATAVTDFVVPALITLKQGWDDIWPTLKNDVLPVLRDVGTFLLEHKPLLIGIAAAILLVTNPWLLVVATLILVLAKWDEIKAMFTVTIPAAIDSVIKKVSEIPIIGEIFKGALEAVKVLVEFYWSFYSTLIGTYINVIKNTIQLVLALIRGDWDRAWQEVKQIVDTVWSGIKGIIDAFLGLIQGGLRVGLDVVKGIFGDTWNAIKGAVIGAMNGVIGTVEGGVNKVIEAIRGLFQHVKNVADAFPGPNPLGNAMQAAIDGMSAITLGRIPQAGEEGGRLGGAVIDGVTVGINARTPDMVLAASRAADQVTGQMKRVWEVQSPSKVMRRIGEELTKGLQLGMGAPALMLPKIPALGGAFNIAAPPRLATAVAAGSSVQGGNTYYITIPLEYHGESSMAETERMRDRLLADLRASLNHEGLG